MTAPPQGLTQPDRALPSTGESKLDALKWPHPRESRLRDEPAPLHSLTDTTDCADSNGGGDELDRAARRRAALLQASSPLARFVSSRERIGPRGGSR
jgi:hypothetical protein